MAGFEIHLSGITQHGKIALMPRLLGLFSIVWLDTCLIKWVYMSSGKAKFFGRFSTAHEVGLSRNHGVETQGVDRSFHRPAGAGKSLGRIRWQLPRCGLATG
jgi:hypothetical protein